jgi:competence protein ComEC
LLFVALAAGVTTVLFGSLVDSLASLPGFICELSLRAMRWLIESAASIPWGHFWLPAPPAWWVLIFYAVMAATLFLPQGRTVSSLRLGWIAGWLVIALMLATAAAEMDAGSIEATFVDVGHGTCVVMRFAEDEVWLYDCGRLGNDTGSSRGIDVALWSLGVTGLQGVYLSHADADHFNALPGVLKRFSVAEIITPPGMLDEPEPALRKVRDAIHDSGAVVRELASGAQWTCRGHAVSVLHPPPERLSGSDNANSLVLRIDCGGKTLLLPGDLEPPGTRMLIRAQRPPPGGVLMAPHHGSLRMDAASVLQWSRPGETIVSGGQRARRPEVEQMLSTTGSGVHVTSELGAIRAIIDRDGNIEVRSWAESPW